MSAKDRSVIMTDAAAPAVSGTPCQIIAFPARRAAQAPSEPNFTRLNTDCPFAFQDAMRRVEAEVYGA